MKYTEYEINMKNYYSYKLLCCFSKDPILEPLLKSLLLPRYLQICKERRKKIYKVIILALLHIRIICGVFQTLHVQATFHTIKSESLGMEPKYFYFIRFAEWHWPWFPAMSAYKHHEEILNTKSHSEVLINLSGVGPGHRYFWSLNLIVMCRRDWYPQG